MANTYTQIYLHIIFAVRNCNSLIPAIYLPRVHTYIAGILKQHGHFPYAVGGIDSHVHIMLGYNVNHSVPDLVRDLKSSSSRFINESHLIPYRFGWQAGYGCFSYSRSQVDAVCQYINRQHEHHKSVTLEQEMKTILDRMGVDYDPDYMIKDPE